MSAEDETDKLCHRWVIEFDCWQMWTEFSKSGTVDDVTKRCTVWRCSWYPDNTGDRETHGFRLVIHFMCKIAEAAKEMSVGMPPANENDVMPRQTALEEAIDLLVYMSNAFPFLEGDQVNEVKLCLRRFAVLVPLCRDDQATAKVYLCVHILCEITVKNLWPYRSLQVSRV